MNCLVRVVARTLEEDFYHPHYYSQDDHRNDHEEAGLRVRLIYLYDDTTNRGDAD